MISTILASTAVVKSELAQRRESEVLVELLAGSEFAGFVQKRSD